MGWQQINTADEPAAREMLACCCGAARWADGMLKRRPFASLDELVRAAGEVWDSLGGADYLEAFTHHPRIGEKSLREKFAATSTWASGEQAGVRAASEDTIRALAELNDRYFEKFGHIFIVCATGKSADEMLAVLRARLPNDPDTELRIAAAEQQKITEIRLRKL